mmetsp:Transcript_49853/g.120803  ORF Transcript_49853/g.120803 Transcript_49853/m.120803 type:complete len:463 (+) Transcript_49853:229-1617(+)
MTGRSSSSTTPSAESSSRPSRRPRPSSSSSLVVLSFRVLLVVTVTLGSAFFVFQVYVLEKHLQLDQFTSSKSTTATIERYSSILDNTFFGHNDQHHDDNNNKNDRLSGQKSPINMTLNEAEVETVISRAATESGWSDDELEERRPLFKILHQANYKLDSFFENRTKLQVLPKWSDIMETYGPPKLWGLEWCNKYQLAVTPDQRNMAVAGAFDSGTNLLSSLLTSNCIYKERPHKSGDGIHWQVPWGKHYPVEYRTNHTLSSPTKKLKNVPLDTVFTVTVVRDPMTWMQSMCRQSYTAQFDHDDSTCPNIIPYPEDIKAHPRYGKMKYMPVHAKFDGGLYIKYESLAHMWNLWYKAYLSSDDDFPRLIVRLEDLVFHAETIIPQICTCAGGTHKAEFVHSSTVQNQNIGIDTSNVHEGLYRSIVRYGTTRNRRKGYPPFQLDAIKDILDPSMMDVFGYPYEEA